ncbi:MAG: hypothetical protein WAL02_06820, partial [Rhodoplanes sp.]
LDARPRRNRRNRGSVRHGVALLRGISTPSLAAQGGQRLPSYFNIDRDIPCFRFVSADWIMNAPGGTRRHIIAQRI